MYVAILALDHSRSTITDIFLGQQLSGLSLGEVRRTAFPVGGEVTRLEAVQCSCGRLVNECRFWSPILAKEGHERYVALLELALERCVFDSSKDIAHLKKLRIARLKSGIDVPIVPVVVIRSFSSWYISARKSLRREGRGHLSSLLEDRRFVLSSARLYCRRFRGIAAIEWAVTNARLIFACRGNGILVTSSDDLIRVPSMLARISNPARPRAVPGETVTHEKHIVRGNRVRSEDKGQVRIREFQVSSIVADAFRYLHRFVGMVLRRSW